jgi:hypothetical protein
MAGRRDSMCVGPDSMRTGEIEMRQRRGLLSGARIPAAVGRDSISAAASSILGPIIFAVEIVSMAAFAESLEKEARQNRVKPA